MNTVTIHPVAKKLAMALVGLVVAGLLFGAAMVATAPKAAAALCDVASLRTLLSRATDDHKKREFEQIIKVCLEPDGTLDNGEENEEASPTSTTSTTTSVTSTPATTAPTTNKPGKPAWYGTLDPTDEQFYANWPAKLKTSVNSYGPTRAIDPALKGKSMEKLTADEANQEQEYVNNRDRMQTATGMVYQGMSDKDVSELLKEYVNDREAWERDRAKLSQRWDSMKREIRPVEAGTPITMTRALPGNPPIVDKFSITMPYDTRWLVYTDRKTGAEFWYRLKCHFQVRFFPDRQQPAAARVPEASKPPKGIEITPEGSPVKQIKVCRPSEDSSKPGTVIPIKQTDKRSTDLPPDSPACKPSSTPSETTSTTPPPTTTTPPTTPPTTSTPSTSLNPKDPSKDGGDSGQNENTGPGEYVPPSEATQSHSPPATYNPPPATHVPTTAPPVVVNPDPTPTRTSDPTDTSTGVVPVPSTTLPGGF